MTDAGSWWNLRGRHIVARLRVIARWRRDIALCICRGCISSLHSLFTTAMKLGDFWSVGVSASIGLYISLYQLTYFGIKRRIISSTIPVHVKILIPYMIGWVKPPSENPRNLPCRISVPRSLPMARSTHTPDQKLTQKPDSGRICHYGVNGFFSSNHRGISVLRN
jgi:hypothetical protein